MHPVLSRAVAVVCLTAAAMILSSPAASTSAVFDLVILGGRVIDPESGLDAVRSIGITDGRVAAISTEPLEGRQTLHAHGNVVAPGFIDLHQHAQHADGYRLQALGGVTSTLDLEEGTTDVDGWYAARAGRTPINYGIAVSHLYARRQVMDGTRSSSDGRATTAAASPAEQAAILRVIENGIRAGAPAVGLLIEAVPGTTPWEVYEVLKLAASHSTPVHVHMRSLPPSLYFLDVEEMLGGAAATGASVHIVHLQSSTGEDAPRVLEMLRGARSRGIDITTEIYPYTASMTGIETAAYADWESWPDEKFRRFEWPATGERLTRQTFAAYRKRGGPVVDHNNTEAVVRSVLSDPMPMIASDGVMEGTVGHPRTAGTYARVLGRYVREERLLTLQDALRRMTLEPARRLERRVPAMARKGRIRIGSDADIVVFDPVTVIDRATYREPAQPSAGIRHVIVNGVPVVRDATFQPDAHPGQPVRAGALIPPGGF